MRFLPLCALALASSCAALSGENHSPPHADSPPEPPSWMSMPRKLFDAFILGKAPPIDYVARDADDKVYGMTRLTDANFDEYKGTPAAKDDIWIILVNGPPGDKISDHLIAAHNNASIQAKQEGLGKLSGVHWARLDFQEEWQTCARWVLLRPPMVVVAMDDFRSLRFVAPGMLPETPDSTSGDKLYEVVKRKAYENLAPWNGRLSPGGSWEAAKEVYIVVWRHWNRYFGNVPRVVWLLGSGALTQFLMKFLHSDLKGAPGQAQPGQKAGAVSKEKRDAARAAIAAPRTKKTQ